MIFIPGYDKNRSWLNQPHLPYYLALLAVVLTLPVLSLGLQMDDLAHRAILLQQFPDRNLQDLSLFGLFSWIDGNPFRVRQLFEFGLPWWSYAELKITFWRPLTEIAHWLDYQLWPESPALMHLHNILWFGAVVWAVANLYRRVMGSSSVAGLAALLYAVSRTHADSLIMVACRSSLMATFFGVLTLSAFIRRVKDGWKPGVVIGPGCLLVALLSAEYAIVTIAYLLAYTAFLDQRSLKNRFLSLSPYLGVLTVWMVVYKVAGFGSFGSGFYTDPLAEPLPFLAAVVDRLPLLFAVQFATLPGGLLFIVSPSVSVTIRTGSLVFMTITCIFFYPLVRKDVNARFWASGLVLAMIPMCASLPDDRLLIFVGIGGFGLLAQFLHGIFTRADWLPDPLLWKVHATGLFLVLFLIHLVISPFTLPAAPARMTDFTDNMLKYPALHLPVGSEISRQTLVLVNPPSALLAAYLIQVRLSENLPLPERTWVLASGSDWMEVYRKDERTLEIQLHNGFIFAEMDKLYRSPSLPMEIGQQVDLSGITVTVLSLTEEGRPLKASFRFYKPLEHSSLNFLQWGTDSYVPFTIPEIGATRFLAAAQLSF